MRRISRDFSGVRTSILHTNLAAWRRRSILTFRWKFAWSATATGRTCLRGRYATRELCPKTLYAKWRGGSSRRRARKDFRELRSYGRQSIHDAASRRERRALGRSPREPGAGRKNATSARV